ncbi:hypothetical protein NAEGRDRAFT_50112 [Naegleria gruberi]|uniref:F-box domain-containing protein n=1 Tax=Naegleria gruberi TaxID=5762 RepID=D2VJR0_NAEGR|nr:uncharacterized protein NAEGRDRAFT_50112 [Naegleria gruberi]EFC43076.1 hypothetical protein NAEGRDRAFT_50112 [Naegleria gruberi]|eukprot:XP_002675820.1 hypothetical protein NAEGRDRAFT_50112 [Naegleria gruberi strain NEG-M]
MIEPGDDCISEILSFLPLGDLLLRAALVNKNWFSIIETQQINWLRHIRCFLEQTASRYEDLVASSLQHESELILPNDDFHNYQQSPKGMRGIYKKRAKQLRRKLEDDEFLENVASCQVVLMRIMAHEWYYLFHHFRISFQEIKWCLNSQDVKEILFCRNLNYIPRSDMEVCTRDFLVNFAKLSHIYSKGVERVLQSENFNYGSSFHNALLKTVNYDLECIEISILKNPTLELFEKIPITQIPNLEDCSCCLFREMMKRISLRMPYRHDLSELFNARFDFFQIAIEEVSKRSPRGVYVLLGERLGKCERIFDIENPQLEAYIVRYYKLEHIFSQYQEYESFQKVKPYLNIFLQSKPYKTYQTELIRQIIITKIREGAYEKLVAMLELFRNYRGLPPKFKAEEIGIHDDERVYYSMFNARDGGLDLTFLEYLLECSDYSGDEVWNKLQEREPSLMKRYYARLCDIEGFIYRQ